MAKDNGETQPLRPTPRKEKEKHATFHKAQTKVKPYWALLGFIAAYVLYVVLVFAMSLEMHKTVGNLLWFLMACFGLALAVHLGWMGLRLWRRGYLKNANIHITFFLLFGAAWL